MKHFSFFTLLVLCAFLSLAQQQKVKKYVTIELFSNTYCGTCAIFDPPAIETYLQNKADIHLISIHPNVPYPQCPFYNANQTDNLARRIFYGSFTSTPRTFTNGTQVNNSSSLITQNLIDNNTGLYSPLRIEVIESGFSNNKTVAVNIKSFVTPPTTIDLRLYVANVVELVNFDAQNGLKEHHNVLWQFLTSENGDVINPASLNQSITKTFQYNTDNLTHPSFDASQVYTIAYIQNNSTKTVINSGSSKDIIVDATITDSDCGASNGAIDLNISGGSGNYGVFWAQGAFTQNINNISDGTYTVTVTDNFGASVTNQFTVNCCVQDLVLEFNQITDQVYKAGNSINSTANILADIEYKAGNRIILNEGFRTNNPHSFSVKIGGCQ